MFAIANEYIQDYRFQSHICLKSITPLFFTRLALPQPAKKASAIKTKVGRDRLRSLLVHSKDSPENSFFEDEVTINLASAFMEKLMTRVYYKEGISQTKEDPMFGTALDTQVEAIHQLEVILAEPDFSKDIPSPRCKFALFCCLN